jgi:hypothetical protein
MQIACIAQMFLCLSVLAASPGSSQQTSESVTVQVKTMARKPNGTLACIPEPNVCPPLCGAVACWLCVAFKVISCAASRKFARGCFSFPSQAHAVSLFLRSCVPSEMMSNLLQVFGMPDVTCDASASIATQTQVCAQRPSACLCLMVTCCAVLTLTKCHLRLTCALAQDGGGMCVAHCFAQCVSWHACRSCSKGTDHARQAGPRDCCAGSAE